MPVPGCGRVAVPSGCTWPPPPTPRGSLIWTAGNNSKTLTLENNRNSCYKFRQFSLYSFNIKHISDKLQPLIYMYPVHVFVLPRGITSLYLKTIFLLWKLWTIIILLILYSIKPSIRHTYVHVLFTTTCTCIINTYKDLMKKIFFAQRDIIIESDVN